MKRHNVSVAEEIQRSLTEGMKAMKGSAHFGWCKHSIGLFTMDGVEYGLCSQRNGEFSFYECADCKEYSRRFIEISGSKPRIKLDYMVNPDELKQLAYVENPIWAKIIVSGAVEFNGNLGNSGRKLADAGLSFCFEADVAKELVKMGLVEEIK